MKNFFFRNLYLPPTAFIFILLLQQVQAGEKEAWQALEDKDYHTAYQEFLPLAKDGNIAAQHYIGLMYHNGYGVKPDYSQAALWFNQVINNPGYNIGNPASLKNPQESILELKQFAHEMLCTIYGINNQIGQAITYDLNKASIHCLGAADKAHFPEVRFLAGRLYMLGQGVVQDDGKAFYWYNKSIEEDNYPKSFGGLAYLYLHGKGTVKNANKAAEFALAGAQLNDTYSQILISGLYLQGTGIDQNYVKSFFWSSIVLLHGDLNDSLKAQVRTMREQALSHLSTEEFADAQRQIFAWKPPVLREKSQ